MPTQASEDAEPGGQSQRHQPPVGGRGGQERQLVRRRAGHAESDDARGGDGPGSSTAATPPCRRWTPTATTSVRASAGHWGQLIVCFGRCPHAPLRQRDGLWLQGTVSPSWRALPTACGKHIRRHLAHLVASASTRAPCQSVSKNSRQRSRFFRSCSPLSGPTLQPRVTEASTCPMDRCPPDQWACNGW
jgi:hypothetical protein